MDGIKYAWQKLYRNVLLEPDSAKLPGLVMAAETAMFIRMQALGENPSEREERQALHDACDKLLKIKREILGWPTSLRPLRRSKAARDSAESAG